MIRTRVTSIGRPPATKRSVFAVASPFGPIQRLHLHPRGTTAKAERECGPGGQSNQAAAREPHEYPWLHLFYPGREHLRTS